MKLRCSNKRPTLIEEFGVNVELKTIKEQAYSNIPADDRHEHFIDILDCVFKEIK